MQDYTEALEAISREGYVGEHETICAYDSDTLIRFRYLIDVLTETCERNYLCRNVTAITTEQRKKTGKYGVLTQFLYCVFIRFATVELIQHIFENLLHSNQPEQSHARAQFQIIRVAHNPVNGPLKFQELLTDLHHMAAEHRIIPVFNSFRFALDFIVQCHSAMAKALNLRKNIPHPVALLFTSLDFLQCNIIGTSMGTSESV